VREILSDTDYSNLELSDRDTRLENRSGFSFRQYGGAETGFPSARVSQALSRESNDASTVCGISGG